MRFVAPAVWQSLGAGADSLVWSEDAGVESLWDASSRLMLAAWQGACPRSLMRVAREARGLDAGLSSAAPALLRKRKMGKDVSAPAGHSRAQFTGTPTSLHAPISDPDPPREPTATPLPPLRPAGEAPADSGKSLLLPEHVASAWLTAARRWLRRNAGIGLSDLIRRPAELAATPTHVDVFFDLAQADMRLRRAGLDLDPGWLPWFGRVVAYHFVERGRS
jgi:hypothetical protein